VICRWSRHTIRCTERKVPDSMPWILWNSPVEVRPRERAARPGSSREVSRVTGSTEFPDERPPRWARNLAGRTCSEPRCSPVNLNPATIARKTERQPLPPNDKTTSCLFMR